MGCSEDDNRPEPTIIQEVDVPSISKTQTRPAKRKAADILASCETPATANLSNSELQRLVLLKQLEVLELKKQKLTQELGGCEVVLPQHVCKSLECVSSHIG